MYANASNILDVYNRASDSAIDEGMAWYPNAHDFARNLDARWQRSAGVIAALSPLNHWDNNKAKAELFYSVAPDTTGAKIGLFKNVQKSLRIFNGEDALDVLGGDKVRSFYLTIIDPTGDHSPVIDRHAFDIAVGSVTNDKTRAMLGRTGMYRTFANAYQNAARCARISPSQLQAVTWIQWRQEKGVYGS